MAKSRAMRECDPSISGSGPEAEPSFEQLLDELIWAVADAQTAGTLDTPERGISAARSALQSYVAELEARIESAIHARDHDFDAVAEDRARLIAEVSRLQANALSPEEEKMLCLAITSSADRHNNPELTVLYKKLRFSSEKEQ
jgi:hypothetical protein